MILGFVDFFYAWAMVTANPPAINGNATFHWFNTIAPIRAWSCLWIAVGLVCVVYSFRRYDRLGWMAAVGVKMLWGLLSLSGYYAENVSIGSVGIWLGLALIVWRLSGWREPEPEREDES